MRYTIWAMVAIGGLVLSKSSSTLPSKAAFLELLTTSPPLEPGAPRSVNFFFFRLCTGREEPGRQSDSFAQFVLWHLMSALPGLWLTWSDLRLRPMYLSVLSELLRKANITWLVAFNGTWSLFR